MPTDLPPPLCPPRDPGELTIHSFRDGDAHVIALGGEIDLATVPALERELGRVSAGRVHVIAIDLRALRFVDSNGLRVIWETHQRLSRSGGELVVVRGNAAVQRPFEICGLGDRLPFVDELRSSRRAAGPTASLTMEEEGTSQTRRDGIDRRAGDGTLASAIRRLRTRGGG